jgi:succinate dehydrogenase / fumarate reductase flavoprotein subunit
VFRAKAVVLATGGIGKAWKVTSNSWEYTGDGHALALWAGADLVDMEFVQFHPTGMVWPPSVRGILVTEGVRGDGGVLRNAEGRRFMFDYIPEMFRSETAETEDEADRWYDDRKNNRRTPDLLPRDEVARAINTEVKEGRGSPHGGVFLDIASRKPADYIQRRLPSMYHQFKELADVDITREPMEVGPTCHYVMGGIRVDPDTQAATVPGLFAAGEAAGGMHGANRLGGNSLSDLLVFGPAGRPLRRRARGHGGRPAGRSTPTRWRRPSARPWPRSSGPTAASTPTPSSRSSRTACRTWSGSSAPRDELKSALERIAVPQGAGRRGRGRGAPPVQPGLAPGPGPALAADRGRVRGPGRPGAPREPRRPHPRRLPQARPRAGQGSRWSSGPARAR